MPAERGSQFHEIKTSTLAGGDDVPEIRRNEMVDREGNRLAHVEYEHDPEVNHTYVTWMDSAKPGHGHMTALMNHLYSQYPKHSVDWGSIIHPAAAHLFKKFAASHPHRTHGEVNIDEDYARDLQRGVYE
jgi:hypothetical protein